MPGRFRGFSLLELMAVMTILGLAAATIVIGLRKPLQNARFESVVDRIIDFDNRIRRRCESTNQSRRMVLDLKDQVIREIDGTKTERFFNLPAGHLIERFVSAENNADRGQIGFRVDNNGSSLSYAVRISGPAASRWLVCLGGTGQFFESGSDDEVGKFFQELYEARIDAN